jgi:hypothetical protein
MRKVIIAIALTIAATAAHAQRAEPAPPDFSPDHLRQIFTTEDQRPQTPHKFHFGFGTIEFRALGMEWRIGYLPILAPLHGSVPATTKVWPDAFSLNHMELPGALPIPQRDADMRRELRRIARITATP